MNKTCKQCLSSLPDTDEFFKSYVPRGNGLRKTTVGRNTICRECERLNGTATRIWKQGADSQKERDFLEKIAEYYKVLVSRGGTPLGAYAKHVLQDKTKPIERNRSALDEMFDSVVAKLDAGDPFLLEYDKLLSLELIKEPDVYQEMLENLRERTAGPDGRVKPEYKDKFEAVATRFDEYEDNYEWD